MRLGADKTNQNLNGQIPMDAFLKANRNIQDFKRTFGLRATISLLSPDIPTQYGERHRQDTVALLASLRALLSDESAAVLIDGWLSPRMLSFFMGRAKSEKAYMTYTFDEGDPREAEWVWDLIYRYEYIPAEVIPKGAAKQTVIFFSRGWYILFTAISNTVNEGKAPTWTNVQKSLAVETQSNALAQRSVQTFYDFGGKLEFAIAALLDLTEQDWIEFHGGDGDSVYDVIDSDEIEALPATPLDGLFQVARFKCLDCCGAVDVPVGVYNHDQD